MPSPPETKIFIKHEIAGFVVRQGSRNNPRIFFKQKCPRKRKLNLQDLKCGKALESVRVDCRDSVITKVPVI
jgi:hypothetical protein